MLFLERPDSRDGEYPLDSELLECVDVGAKVEFRGQQPVPAAVPRQESDLAPLKFAQDKSIAWLAERGLHVHFAHRGESGHGIQATAPDYSNFCLLQSVLRLKLRK